MFRAKLLVKDEPASIGFDTLAMIAAWAVVVCSIVVGLQGSTWGQPYGFHSDEFRYLTRLVDDPSVPVWTIYGRWPIYFQLAVAQLAGHSPADLILARSVTVFVNAVALLAIMLAARQLAGWKCAALAAALLAGAPIVAQSADFFITDVWLYAFLAVSILFCFRQIEHATWLNAIVLGCAWGIAAGSKLSGLFFLPAIVLAYLFGQPAYRWRRFAVTVLLAALLTLLGQPTLLRHGLQAYLDTGQLLEHLQVAAGTILPSYSLQFANTPPWTYYVVPLLWWGAGPLLLLLGSVGGVTAFVQLIRGRHAWRSNKTYACLAITLASFAAFYLTLAGQYSKYTRYILPLLLPLALLAGWWVAVALQKLRPAAAGVTFGFVMAAGLIPGLMYSQIHLQPDTRLQAALWVADHIPAGSTICHEPDVGFAVPPIGLGGPAYGAAADRNYRGIQLNWGLLYAASDYLHQHQRAPVIDLPETQALRTQAQQAAQIQSWLAACDWVILSDRFADQYMPLASDFPAIGGFYQNMLTDRQPDFKQIVMFRSLPKLLDFTIDDRASELTLRSFDHPTIWIFQRR